MSIKPEAILFDMDGVLVDSLDSWWASLNESLTKYGQAEITRDEFINKYWGHDLQYNLEKMGLSYEILTFCNIAYSNHVNDVKIYPDVISTLEKLKHYKKAIITNTPEDCTKQIVKNLGIDKYFNAIVTVDDVSRGKPSPEIVLKACDLLKINPKDVVLIGDTDSDVKAGKTAGCTVVGIKIDADYTITTLSELTEIIDYSNI